MIRYVAVLRGINVGGKNILKMAALSEALKTLHFEEIVTYIQSGNLAFNAPKQAETTLATQISTLILAQFGLTVPTIVLTQSAVQQIISKNPYVGAEINEKSLHITFLSAVPSAENVHAFLGKITLPDECTIIENAAYSVCEQGYSKSKLTNKLFEKTLEVTATARNWNTSLKLTTL